MLFYIYIYSFLKKGEQVYNMLYPRVFLSKFNVEFLN